MSRPRRRPPTVARVASASRDSLRPCAPTEHPFSPGTTHKCPCGQACHLEPRAPLPDGWITVQVRAKRGGPERVGYRCDRCTRRQLVFELLADDLALGTVTRGDARRLAGWVLKQDLDRRGICVMVRRLQAEHGAAAWAGVMASVEKLEVQP